MISMELNWVWLRKGSCHTCCTKQIIYIYIFILKKQLGQKISDWFTVPRSLVAPGKQGPADLFINRYIHTCTNLCAPHLSLSMTLSTYLYNYTQWLGKASATPAAPNSIVKSNNYCHNLGLPGEGLLATPAGAKWISLNDFNRTELGLAESGIRSCHTCYLQQPVNRQPGFRLGDSESKLG